MSVQTQTLRVSDAQFKDAVGLLGEFVAIPSVSNPDSEDYRPENMQAAANFSARKFEELGFKVEVLTVGDSQPFVVAQKIQDKALPTILLYAHGDVQPVERDQWNTAPFVMVEKDNRLYGRGASDDKAGVVAMMTAFQAYKEANRPLPCNVTVLIEHEEEYGSGHMGAFLQEQAKRLQASAMLILDGGNKDTQTGTTENSTRGVVTFEMEVTALEKPVHSGTGCLVPDSGMAMAKLIASLENPRNIPGFMDDCDLISEEEARLLDESSISEEAYREENGVLPGGVLRGNPAESIFRRIVEEPSLSILNMTYGKKGGGNSIQDKAHCTFGVRLTPGQDPNQITNLVINYLHSQTVHGGCGLNVRQAGLTSPAWKANLSGPFAKCYMRALERTYTKTAVMPTGGTLPLITDFEKAFPEMEILVGAVEDPKTAAHSHNESQDIGILRNAMDSLIEWMEEIGKNIKPA
ncbi:MAG: M20/M25/M40 family metallo-hydrolase [Chlamydiota bacterium]|jgi:acetylornithine deacetylase/succinyl-diaminopimelate desuccinylase-like protein